MANHLNRIEKLEKRAQQKRPASHGEQVVTLVLQHLSDEHLQMSLTGFTVDLDKREPNESEAPALAAYRCAFQEGTRESEQDFGRQIRFRESGVGMPGR